MNCVNVVEYSWIRDWICAENTFVSLSLVFSRQWMSEEKCLYSKKQVYKFERESRLKAYNLAWNALINSNIIMSILLTPCCLIFNPFNWEHISVKKKFCKQFYYYYCKYIYEPIFLFNNAITIVSCYWCNFSSTYFYFCAVFL